MNQTSRFRGPSGQLRVAILCLRPYLSPVGRSLFSVISLVLAPLLAFSQSVTTEFGKNRIQFTDDFNKWDMYETENFVTYWYGKGREIAHTVVQMAELDNPSIEHILEQRARDPDAGARRLRAHRTTSLRPSLECAA